jgi:FkbM family methyltransferase
MEGTTTQSATQPLRDWAAVADKLRFVDVGSRGGLQAKWHPHMDEICVIMFEPDAAEAVRVRNDIGQRFDCVVIDSALYHTVGRRKLYITENATCISLREPNHELLRWYDIQPHLKLVGEDEVACARYDTLYYQGRVPTPDALKIDVQGCEHEVLLGFGGLLQTCLGIELETQFYPVYRGQKLLHDIIAYLGDFGFVLRALEPVPHFDGDYVEANAFFTKARAAVRAYDATQRRKFDLLTKVWGLTPYRL